MRNLRSKRSCRSISHASISLFQMCTFWELLYTWSSPLLKSQPLKRRPGLELPCTWEAVTVLLGRQCRFLLLTSLCLVKLFEIYLIGPLQYQALNSRPLILSDPRSSALRLGRWCCRQSWWMSTARTVPSSSSYLSIPNWRKLLGLGFCSLQNFNVREMTHESFQIWLQKMFSRSC